MTDDVGGGRRPSRLVVARFLVGGTFGYALRLAKNVVKRVLGRPPHFTADDVLYRVYVRQLFGGPKLRKITCISSTHEGAGSQASIMMMAIDFARTTGLTYVHTPFSDVWHADRPMKAWAAAWEAHFNLGAGEIPIDSKGRDRDAVNFGFTFPLLRTLFGVEQSDRGFDDEMVGEFRRRYYLDKSPRTNDVLAVCVHARRFNRHDFHREDSVDLPMLARTIARIRSVLDARGLAYTLRLFSQGKVDEFRGLDIPDDALFLDADPIWSMREMIEADILVTTLGTFSYVTGLLCDGIVLAFEPVSPARGWIACDANGHFDTELLASRLP